MTQRKPQTKGETMTTATEKRFPSTEAFIDECNGRNRKRLFGESDWQSFRKAVRATRRSARNGKPCYREDNGGGVANSYKYVTTTPRWWTWSLPNGEVVFGWDRTIVSGSSVKKAYYMGDRAYQRDFAAANLDKLRTAGE